MACSMSLVAAFHSVFPMSDKNSNPIPSLGKRDWIVLTAFIVAVAAGFAVYSEWIGPEVGLRRIEGNMKSNLPLRIDPNKTLVRRKIRQKSQQLLVCSQQR
jgi:ABC-type phosphate/phosphonate transport system permease subunit